jgi:hypothetical protein
MLPVLSDGSLGSTLSVPIAGLSSSGPLLQGIAVDTQGEIFVGELPPSGTTSTPLGAVLVFSANPVASSTPVRTIKGSNTSLFSPIAVAVDAAGDLYVVSPGMDIVVFAPGADGNATPVRRLAVPFSKNTGIVSVDSICVDPTGNLYVMNNLGNGVNNILVFGPTQNGDVAPIRTIAGSAALTNGIFGGAFDAAGNLYVGSQSITPAYVAILEFAAGASGNVDPIRTISGSNTTLTSAHVTTNPVLDSAGNLYVIAYSAGPTQNLLKFAADANGNASPAAITPSGTIIDSFAIAWH